MIESWQLASQKNLSRPFSEDAYGCMAAGQPNHDRVDSNMAKHPVQ